MIQDLLKIKEMSLVKRNKPALVISLLIGLIFILPHFLIPSFLKSFKKYNPLILNPLKGQIAFEETYTYLPATQEVLEGRFPRDSYIFEYKDMFSPFIGETFSSLVMATLTKIFSSITLAFTIADFLFPLLIFLVLYFLMLDITKDKLLSIVVGATILFVPEFFAAIPYPKALWKYFFNFRANQFLFFSRNFHPQLSFLIWFIALYFLYKALRSDKKRFVFLAGLFLGLLFYTYLFYWTFTWFSFVILFIFLWLINDFKLFRKMFFIGLLGLMIGSFYLFNLYMFRQSSLAVEFFEKMSYPIQTKLFLISLRYIVLAVITGGFLRREKGFLFWFLLLSGSLLPALAQLVLKKNLEFDHFFYRALMPLGTINLFIIIGRIKKHSSSKQYWRIVLLIFLGLLFLSGVLRQTTVAIKTYNIYIRNEAKEEMLSWFNKNTEKDSVIACLDYDQILSIPAFTHNRTYTPMSNRSLASTEEALRRYLEIAGFLKLDKDILTSLFFPQNTSLELDLKERANTLGALLVFKHYGQEPSEFKQLFSNQLLKQYQNLQKKGETDIFSFKIDFLLIGPLEKKLNKSELEKNNNLKKVFENSDYAIYRTL